MIMFLIKLLSIIVFDLCTNICCIYSVCKNCCKDDAIKKTNSLNENFLESIEFKDDGRVYYNCSSQGFDQIGRDQVEGIVNSEYSETVFFYGINKELYNLITRKSYIKFKGTQNIGKCKDKSVKKKGIDQKSLAEEKEINNSDKDMKEAENENNENKNENENNIETKKEIKTILKINKNVDKGETNLNNIEKENSNQDKTFVEENEKEAIIDETKEDNGSNIVLYNDVFKGCDVVMDKFVLFAVKTNDGNCYLGFCSDGNSKEVREEVGSKTKGLFEGSTKNVEIKMISCGGKLENVADMFRNNSNLKNIVFTPLFVPLSVTNMTGMFAGCSELEELDLFNFNSASTSEKNQINMGYMFSECSKLKKLTFPYLDNTKFLLICNNMFYQCTSLRKCNLMVDNDNIIANFEFWKPENIKLEEETKKENEESKEGNEENKEITSKEGNEENKGTTSKEIITSENKNEKK